MPITRKVIRALFEDPTSTDVELAAKVFGECTIKDGQLSVPIENEKAIERIVKYLTQLRPAPAPGKAKGYGSRDGVRLG